MMQEIASLCQDDRSGTDDGEDTLNVSTIELRKPLDSTEFNEADQAEINALISQFMKIDLKTMADVLSKLQSFYLTQKHH